MVNGIYTKIEKLNNRELAILYYGLENYLLRLSDGEEGKDIIRNISTFVKKLISERRMCVLLLPSAVNSVPIREKTVFKYLEVNSLESLIEKYNDASPRIISAPRQPQSSCQ
jgi:hypothetical protein